MKSLAKSLARPFRLPTDWNYIPPPGIRLSDVRTLPELAERAEAWDELLLQSGRSAPVLSYTWITAYLKHQLRPRENWLCLFAYDGARLVGVLPLVTGKCYSLAGLRLTPFQLPSSIYHTSGADCLTQPGREDILATFVDYLNHIPRTTPVVLFRLVPEVSTPMRLARTSDALWVSTHYVSNENSVPLPKTRAEYAAGMSSNLRRYLKKNGRRLEKLPDVRYRVREQERSLNECLTEFIEVENRNWKGSEQSSVKARPADLDMLTEIAQAMTRHGWMVWNFLEADGKTIAGQYAVLINRILNLVKIGFDDNYRFCSPGNLLMDRVISEAIESSDVDEVNMMTDLDWHHKWQTVPRPLFNAVVFPRSPLIGALARLGLLEYVHRGLKI